MTSLQHQHDVLTVFDRGDRGVGVRDIVLAVPSVGCTNRTTELLGRARPDIRILTHQHGCGQIGDDLTLTTDVLARVCAHPNVRAAVIIGLGCESNQPRRLAERAAALGATVECTILQENGGSDATIRAATELADLHGAAAARISADPGRLRVSLVTDAEAPPRGDDLRGALAAHLQSLGIEVLDSGRLLPPQTHALTVMPSRVYVSWERRSFPDLDGVLSRPVHSLAEHLAAAAARGAHMAVVLSGRGVPTGSPVVPTLKVGVGPRLGPLIGETVDVDATREDEPVDEVLAHVTDAVMATLGGRPTLAETAGQRDFGIPRVAPSM